ncbi:MULTISPECIES: thioesterase family protein [unclassified Lentimicrobium]|uniref:acyl-CoA thioesterase n=1 Tax=unclassified Lentimicrobium TaxID=2677434 RepID=UPI0015528D34|nr:MULTISPECIES: thioesterase family protein [unclassified Lentimicrobium]NPD46513.1 acyl-CoA thioesterase [Lentimicrobium sp. S6]NPD85162.1 acyl-CoA thioesterase [Lentimicrobium sp. L6]
MTDFIMKYMVSISDINYGGHMGNDKSLALFHEARIGYLKSLGYSEMNIGEGLGIIMKDAHVDYLAEVFHGDELMVKVSLGEQKGPLFHLNYEVNRVSDAKMVFTGRTGILAFDYEKRKVVRTPQVFFHKIKEHYGY